MWGGRVNKLQNGDGKSGSFSGSGLSLGNGILLLEERENAFLLNNGWLFKTVTLRRSKEG